MVEGYLTTSQSMCCPLDPDEPDSPVLPLVPERAHTAKLYDPPESGTGIAARGSLAAPARATGSVLGVIPVQGEQPDAEFSGFRSYTNGTSLLPGRVHNRGDEPCLLAG